MFISFFRYSVCFGFCRVGWCGEMVVISDFVLIYWKCFCGFMLMLVNLKYRLMWLLWSRVRVLFCVVLSILILSSGQCLERVWRVLNSCLLLMFVIMLSDRWFFNFWESFSVCICNWVSCLVIICVCGVRVLVSVVGWVLWWVCLKRVKFSFVFRLVMFMFIVEGI